MAYGTITVTCHIFQTSSVNQHHATVLGDFLDRSPLPPMWIFRPCHSDTSVRPLPRSTTMAAERPLSWDLGTSQYQRYSKIADIADESKLPKIHLSMW